MGIDLLWTFVSRHVQPLHRREMTMWMYPGPSCPDRPFSTELDDMEINTQIRGILHGANQNCGPGPVHLREGVDSPWVSLIEITFVCLCQFLFFQHICILMQSLGYIRSTLWGGHLT
jgi:hypothetical protein